MGQLKGRVVEKSTGPFFDSADVYFDIPNFLLTITTLSSISVLRADIAPSPSVSCYAKLVEETCKYLAEKSFPYRGFVSSLR
jgi:hypothetical protein